MECDWSVSESDSIFVFGKEAAHKLEVAYGLLSWGGVAVPEVWLLILDAWAGLRLPQHRPWVKAGYE